MSQPARGAAGENGSSTDSDSGLGFAEEAEHHSRFTAQPGKPRCTRAATTVVDIMVKSSLGMYKKLEFPGSW